MQFRDSVWVPFETFFKKERGRRVKGAEVTEIMEATINKLEVAADDNEELFFEIKGSLHTFLATKYGRPLLFNDVCKFAEGCIPGVKSSFLATNDSKFARVVTRPLIYPIFLRVVRDILEVPVVPEVVLAENVIGGMKIATNM